MAASLRFRIFCEGNLRKALNGYQFILKQLDYSLSETRSSSWSWPHDQCVFFWLFPNSTFNRWSSIWTEQNRLTSRVFLDDASIPPLPLPFCVRPSFTLSIVHRAVCVKWVVQSSATHWGNSFQFQRTQFVLSHGWKSTLGWCTMEMAISCIVKSVRK